MLSRVHLAFHARIQDFRQGGPGQSDKKSPDNVFLFLVLSLFYLSQMVNFEENYHFSRFQRGSNIFQGGGSNFFQGGPGGGGGVEARRPENSLDNVFFSHQLFFLQFTEWIQWFYYRGEKGVQLLPGGGGVQRNPYYL